MIQKNVTIINEQGLHARPAQLLAAAAMKCKCDLKALKNSNSNKVYHPKSILSIMSMGAGKGDQITIIADGAGEEAALEKLVDLIEKGFNE